MRGISKIYIFIRNSILILIITFLLGEAVLQFLQVELPYQYTPQKIKQDLWTDSPIVEATLKRSHNSRLLMSAASFDTIVKTNSLGWRDDEPDNRKKILVIGDSFTFGFGVNNDQTIPYNLENIYNNRYDFINLGYTAGISPDSYASYLRFHKNLQKTPIILILYQNDWNDIKSNVCIHEDGSTSPSPTKNCNNIKGTATTIVDGKMFHHSNPIITKIPTYLIYWLKQSYMIGAIRTVLSLVSDDTREVLAINTSQGLTVSDRRRLLYLLDEIYNLSGKSLMIIMLDGRKPKRDNSFYGAVNLFCSQNSELHCLNIASLDRDKYFENDSHYNHMGTKYVANLISEYINESGFLVEQ